MAITQDELAIENMELKAQLHEIKTALGITQHCGSESTPLQRIAAFNRMREIVRDALGIYGEYFVSNEADSMLRAIAKLKKEANTVARSDRLSNPELIQIIRSLLK